MVNYAYRDLFYKSHQTKDILIVNVGATVTPVANAEPTISGASVIIKTEDVVLDSITLDESLCSEEHLKFGLCESSSFTLTIKNTSNVPKLQDDGTLLNVYIYFNGNSTTLFQIGQYVCEKDEYSINRKQRTLEFYDQLHRLWDLPITEWYYNTYASAEYVTVKNLRDSLFTYINTKGYTITQETTTLINDSTNVGKTIQSDVITFGFFMQGLLEVNGVFGHINRQGVFVYKSLVSYDNASVATIVDDFRKPPTQYTDFTTQGIAFVAAYNQNNILMGKTGSTNLSRPSTYCLFDNFVLSGLDKNLVTKLILGIFLQKLREKITHLRYKPCEVQCVGDLCIEVGDKIDVEYDKNGDGVTDTFYTFVMERHMTGLGSMIDTYTSHGAPRQPDAQITNENWHIGDSESTATSGIGTGGVSTTYDEHDQHFCEIIRNVGHRVLDEPSGVMAEYDVSNGIAKFKWTDPDDLTDAKPITCTWAGTIVIRKEDSAPKNIYDGEIIVDSTTRDAYKNTWLEDNTIEENKKYYYGIFPYHIAPDGKQWVRFTKVVCVDTAMDVTAPTIISCSQGVPSAWDGSETDIMWSGNSNKLTVQVASSQIVFKLYSNSTEIYSFTSPVGTSTSDVENIHISFLIDTTNEVAKPSFIYYNGSTYSYNQESPTDAEMGDIYTWLSAGLPSE